MIKRYKPKGYDYFPTPQSPLGAEGKKYIWAVDLDRKVAWAEYTDGTKGMETHDRYPILATTWEEVPHCDVKA